jgi:hypothetical protein
MTVLLDMKEVLRHLYIIGRRTEAVRSVAYLAETTTSCAIGPNFRDKEAARKEAAAVCADMMRGIFGEVAGRREWRLNVTDEAGKLLFRFRVVVEAFD